MRGLRFLMVVVVALVLSVFAAMPAHAAIAKAPKPLSGPSAVKERWRVDGRIYWPDGTSQLIFITWFGLAESIDWSTANVCTYVEYRYYSVFERARGRIVVTGKPVLDLKVPVNGG